MRSAKYNKIKMGLFIIFVVALVAAAGAAYAQTTDEANVVPDASALVLAPMGIAAIVAAERRRRRLAKIKRGVGAAYFFVKRITDIALASAILLALVPLCALIALLVRIDSSGPIVYRRRVVGKHGHEFDMFKFRSMVHDAEKVLAEDEDLAKEYYVNCKLKSDPRVTKIGSFLRKTSLDEIPQLINVILGQMTFVGPRPIANDEIDIYGPAFEQFKTVKPGITGLWQTNGRSETSYAKRVQMDMAYIQERSTFMDVRILINTVIVVLTKQGAH